MTNNKTIAKYEVGDKILFHFQDGIVRYGHILKDAIDGDDFTIYTGIMDCQRGYPLNECEIIKKLTPNKC